MKQYNSENKNIEKNSEFEFVTSESHDTNMSASRQSYFPFLFLFVLRFECTCTSQASSLPLVINTWPFTNATAAGNTYV